jgi:hypothetical protein
MKLSEKYPYQEMYEKKPVLEISPFMSQAVVTI